MLMLLLASAGFALLCTLHTWLTEDGVTTWPLFAWMWGILTVVIAILLGCGYALMEFLYHGF